jgi:chemotaxis receptor (MCP) glutamine deamidase CheD
MAFISLELQRIALQVKLFGGANVLPNSSAAIGTKNIIFIRDFIKKEGLQGGF